MKKSEKILPLVIVISLLFSGIPVCAFSTWYSIYFTPEDRCDQKMVDLINSANSSVYAALYEIKLENVTNALINAYNRSVDVRIVTDNVKGNTTQYLRLKKCGIIKTDHKSYLMHNKFIIIDNKTVWTGSMNPTPSGAYCNNNSVIVINSTNLSCDYTTEFLEMWNGMFGADSPADTPYSFVYVDGTGIECYFAPEDGVEAQIIDKLKSANHSVYFATSTFTSKPIAQTLIELHKKGVEVKGIYEQFQNSYCTFQILHDAGIEVIWDKNPKTMHHKFFVIDNATTITGSYNPTKQANTVNDENVLIIHNKSISDAYVGEFDKMWNKWQPEPKKIVFDTGAGTYPSIFGTHNGTITPNQTITMHKLYTYPCKGTGGHTEHVKIWNLTWNVTANWDGYKGDWHNISFNETFTLVANETYNYTIKTGSYPQIRHTLALPTANGWINCTEFRDANGKIYYDWIPAIKLYF